MHVQAYAFAARVVAALPDLDHVLEVGSRDVNGSIRELLPWRASSYIGVDIAPGPCVDVVADGATFVPSEAPDLVVCMETLEHAEQAAAIVRNAAAMLLRKPGGRLLVTCATEPRAPHSGVDGGPLQAGEFYRNVQPDELVEWATDAGLHVLEREVHLERGDLYLVAAA
jgi:hypothetical protein